MSKFVEPRTNLWPQIEPLLSQVERPSRYIGGEWASFKQQEYAVGLCYPGTYEVGQANQAIQILYSATNAVEGMSAERIYLPWIDFADTMRAHNLELFTLESFCPVKELDLLGITLPYELSFTSILEVLDLSGLALYAKDRKESDPLVIAGGPSVYNPEPIADFIDAFLVGEGEEQFVEVAARHRELKQAGASKDEILSELAQIQGVYVPSLYDVKYDEQGRVASIEAHEQAPSVVYKRLINDMNSVAPVTCPVVPYMDVVHNRLTVEVLRGCTRGCRFCQAGMTYRPVRERTADEIVKAATEGLAQTGYDEVSLTSLSSADHSQLEEILRRLTRSLEGTGISVSLPSLRVDAFSIDMARLISGSGRKTGLTFAPEAGSQRLRDVINKNVTEKQLLDTIEEAFKAGWRRVKLYFMIGLPTETDDDIRAIGELTQKVVECARENVPKGQRGSVSIGVSVSTLVPKAHTPFQWEPQATDDEIKRKQMVLRDSMPRKGVNLSWHDSDVSFLEGVVARGDRRLSRVLEAAWKNGSRYDAWSEQFELQRWLDAFSACDFDPEDVANRARDYNEVLPWSHISTGVSNAYLVAEAKKAHEEVLTPDCSFDACTGCGLCQKLDCDVVLAGGARS